MASIDSINEKYNLPNITQSVAIYDENANVFVHILNEQRFIFQIRFSHHAINICIKPQMKQPKTNI